MSPVDWLTRCLWEAGLTGIPPLALWQAPVPAAAGPVGESWTDHDPDIVRLVYEVLAEQSACGRCGAPLRRVVSIRVVIAPPVILGVAVTARCRSWARHRHVAMATHQRGGLRFEELHLA